MNNMKYILLIVVTLTFLSCEKESPFTEIEGLNSEFPESLFSFSGNYEAFTGNDKVRDSSFLYPRPLDVKSFENFSATSLVDDRNDVRFAECTLSKGTYYLGTKTNNFLDYDASSKFVIKLNIAPVGDGSIGTYFKKQELLDFLDTDNEFFPIPDRIGSIELSWKWDYDNKSDAGLPHYAGFDGSGNSLSNSYFINVVSVEDYQDVTRTGEVIKNALKVTINFEGSMGVRSPLTPIGGVPEADISHIDINGGTATFLVDYLQ